MTNNAFDRKLTTILAADVVGYSELMAHDEEETVERLRTWRNVIDGAIAKHGGRIFNTAGDAVMAEFGSAVEAVRCAISIQEDLRVRNSQFPAAQQMWLRIGINVGDVMIDGENLLGDGVNIAARLEGLADTGGICISGSAFEHIKNKIAIAFDDIGAQKVKNIPEPIAAYKLVPGDVSVKSADKSLQTRRIPIFLLIGSGVVALVAVGLATWIVLPSTTVSSHEFDGHWKVTVNSVAGCLNNDPKNYSVRVVEGRIDEPQHTLPKSGTISRNGEFHIKTVDRSGRQRNTQAGTISGSTGNGKFQGQKPTCTGNVRLERVE